MLPFIKPVKKHAEIYPSHEYILRFDGGSRGNPGISGCGAVLYYNDDEIWSKYLFIGVNQTNNYAEYMGLIIGLEQAVKMNIKELLVEGDSLLVIKQVTNVYKCKSENLLELNEKAINLSKQINTITFRHILRNKNKRADALSNIAMDSYTSL